ncbi:hypothetical protein FRC11_009820, partial [Ceratobasidium sp. 423]
AVNVTIHPPRKRRGINAPPPPSRSGSNSKMNPNKVPTSTNVSPIPSPSIATTSNHLVRADTQQGLFNPPDSGLRSPVQAEEEQSTSHYEDEVIDKLKTVFGLEIFHTN